MRRISLIFLCLFSVALAGQTATIEYEATILTLDGKGRSGITALHFTQDKAIYLHPDWPAKSVYGPGDPVPSYYIRGDVEKMPVYTNLAERKQVFKVTNGARGDNYFILTEPVAEITWDVTGKEKAIGDLKTYEARGIYGNRHYTAWFTPEIPLPFGPHRLGGLPGMILEAASDDGMVKYTFLSYAKDPGKETLIVPPSNGEAIDMEELEKRVIAQLLKVEAMSNSEYTATQSPEPSDLTIEKDKWTIIRDYKAKRGY
ncbi:GLPGLI family protein [Neolewinella lacunae]|uniref:GLPGLI family protein n=1 Tax=Neolewinella lacunae TaxID=1517758 RepID=A0A923PLH7_9BACT|nr:GLPGLI family protein [Neolewinella lacunae]MBC6996272.1 GLPGLI family protein [Neolewinella lacunae]MDN3636895.1 GLPGLI family protein [Neolewinella lacunae]